MSEWKHLGTQGMGGVGGAPKGNARLRRSRKWRRARRSYNAFVHRFNRDFARAQIDCYMLEGA